MRDGELFCGTVVTKSFAVNTPDPTTTHSKTYTFNVTFEKNLSHVYYTNVSFAMMAGGGGWPILTLAITSYNSSTGVVTMKYSLSRSTDANDGLQQVSGTLIGI